MKNSLIVGLLALTLASAAFADVAKEEPKAKSVDSFLMIHIDKDAKDARLIVPKSKLRQLRADLEQLDDGQSAVSTFAFSKLQTIVAGGLLTLAFVFSGVWFARKENSGKAAKVLGIGTVVLVGGTFASLVSGNAGPPAEARTITGKLFAPPVHIYNSASGRIKLETTDDGDNVVLIVPEGKTKPGDE